MSQSFAVGVYGPSHWTCMAQKMVEVFDLAAQKRFLRREDVPTGILKDAAEFCGLVLEGHEVSSNPPASIQAFSVALKAVSARAASGFLDMEKFYLGSAIIIALDAGSSRKFGVRELETTFKFMADFFQELWMMGEKEQTAQTMGFEQPR